NTCRDGGRIFHDDVQATRQGCGGYSICASTGKGSIWGPVAIEFSRIPRRSIALLLVVVNISNLVVVEGDSTDRSCTFGEVSDLLTGSHIAQLFWLRQLRNGDLSVVRQGL